MAVLQSVLEETYQQAVSKWRLEGVFAELADQFGDGQTVVLSDVIEQTQGMVLK